MGITHCISPEYLFCYDTEIVVYSCAFYITFYSLEIGRCFSLSSLVIRFVSSLLKKFH